MQQISNEPLRYVSATTTPGSLDDRVSGEEAGWPHGAHLDRYVICRQIARRPNANLYLAREQVGQGIERFVAIKQLHTHLLTDAQAMDLFLDEARIGIHAQHVNVCQVLDFTSLAGHPCMVMEYLVGESLDTVWKALQGDPISQPHHAARIAHIVADACEGMHAVHEATDHNGGALNAVHRDVTPDNLFVTYCGAAKLLDFSAAQATGQQHETLNGLVKGKCAYMSPEAIQGGGVDRRTDIWSLGVVLWELLTRRHLFQKESDYETLRAVAEEPIPLPSEVRADLPRYYDEVVMRALARERTARYATAREFASALTAVLAHNGHAVGAAEIACWLDDLIPGGREHLHRQLRRAASSEVATAADAGGLAATGEPTRTYSSQRVRSLRQRLLTPLVAFAATVRAGAGPGIGRAVMLAVVSTMLVGAMGAVMGLWLASRLSPSDASVADALGKQAGSTPEPGARWQQGSYRIELSKDSSSPDGVRLRLVRASDSLVHLNEGKQNTSD